MILFNVVDSVVSSAPSCKNVTFPALGTLELKATT